MMAIPGSLSLSIANTSDLRLQRERQIKKTAAVILWFAVAVLLAFSFAFPIYFMITSSFKAETEVLAIPMHWLPQQFQGLSQYQRAFNIAPVGTFYLNSLFMAIVDVIFTVFFSALAGYGFAKYDFPLKNLLFFVIIGTMTVPFQILLVPLYKQVVDFGWVDSYAGLIIPGILNAFGVFMMRQFMYSIPNDLIEAARIDGASELGIFWRVVFPLVTPAAASLAIIIFIWSWNNYLWPLVAVQSQSHTTLPVGMTIFTAPSNSQPVWASAMAVSTLAALPVAVIFIFFQRYFVKGMLTSGLKG